MFCHNVIGTIDPALVLVSGDLTHAKYADGRSSKQFPSEWKAYSNALHRCNLGQIPWLDIRGNHGMCLHVVCFSIYNLMIIIIILDNFDVVSFFDESNFFR